MRQRPNEASLTAVAAVDDPSSAEIIKQSFALCFPECILEFVRTPADCVASLARKHPDIILLDRFLNDGDGFAILRTIRSTCNTPVIMLAYGRDEGSVVAAMDSGADGYLTKPLRQMELIAYVKRLTKFGQQNTTKAAANDK